MPALISEAVLCWNRWKIAILSVIMAKFRVVLVDPDTKEPRVTRVVANTAAEAVAMCDDGRMQIQNTSVEIDSDAEALTAGRWFGIVAIFTTMIGMVFPPALFISIIMSAHALEASKGNRGMVSLVASGIIAVIWLLVLYREGLPRMF